MYTTSAMFPGFDHIYTLDDPLTKRHFVGRLDFNPKHGQDFSLIRAELKPPTPLLIYYAAGSSIPADVIWCTSFLPLISQRVIDLFSEQGFTGWTTYPVELHGKDGNIIPDYYGLAITGRCGSLDFSRSIEVLKDYPAGKFPVRRGLFFDPQSWDGSHFFMATDYYRWIFVTHPVKASFEQGKVRNAIFTSLPEVEIIEP